MGAKTKLPWGKYKVRFIAHEWETCDDMSRALKIPQGTVRRHTKGWHEDRAEIDAAGAEEFKALAIQENAHAQLDIYRDIKPMLQELFLKGINQLLSKKRIKDPRTGAVTFEDVPFSSEATALGASRFGLAGLKLLEAGSLPGAIGGGNNPLILDGDQLNNLNIATIDPRSYTTDQLKAAIDALDTDEGAQEKAANGAAPKKRGTR